MKVGIASTGGGMASAVQELVQKSADEVSARAERELTPVIDAIMRDVISAGVPEFKRLAAEAGVSPTESDAKVLLRVCGFIIEATVRNRMKELTDGVDKPGSN